MHNKDTQSNKNQNKNIKKSYKAPNENLSHKDFENMMKHSGYKRGSNGAIRQVSYG